MVPDRNLWYRILNKWHQKISQLKENEKAKAQIAELQEFVRRFSANASKAKQATSRAKLIDKIKVEEMKPSSRQYPYIRFEYDEKNKLYRQALIVNKLSHSFDKLLFNNIKWNQILFYKRYIL